MVKVKATLICTVYNEEKTIKIFFDSVFKQTVIPTEIIIVDGKSNDKTVEKIRDIQKVYKTLNIKLYVKEGNRSIGRNEAIKYSSNEIILCTDAGNTLDKKWVEKISEPFSQKNVDVVAGYYRGAGKTLLQKSLTPFVLIMKDKVNENDFLPATRSMAFTKNIWKKVGKFNEQLSHNEDFDFARRLKQKNAKIIFTQFAIVNWLPRKNFKQAFVMFFRFAFGDAESSNFRDKVIFIFLRYFVFLYLIFLDYVYRSKEILLILILGFFLYAVWPSLKNGKYVKGRKKILILFTIQLISDVAVMLGTTLGLMRNLTRLNFKKIIKSNKYFLITIIIFSLTVLSSITWGIPNNSHPFLYHMDEWHQMQSVRAVFKYGSPNVIGAANGTMFQFFSVGIYLLPFIAFKIINPFAIKNAIESIDMQYLIFIILRLNTFIYSILTLFVIYRISKNLKLNAVLSVIIFAFTPVWIMLSNNFKYDIAFLFWLTLFLYGFLNYFRKPNNYAFVYASILSAVALSVKVTGITILPLVFVGFFIFTPNAIKNYKRLLMGVSAYLITLILLGVPDIVFNGKNMNDYLSSNLNIVKLLGNNVSTGYSTASLNLIHHFPTVFGHTLFILFLISLVYFININLRQIISKTANFNRFYVFLFFYLGFFVLSFYPVIKLGVGANRALPILPAIVLIVSISVYEFRKRDSINRINLFTLLIIFLLFFQIVETYAWVALKHSQAPQQTSSAWILKNIKDKTVIGIEDIPLYQKEPDIILKEFYNKQYKTNLKLKYKYQIVNKSTQKFPSVVVVTDVKLSEESEKGTAKRELINKLYNENYKIVIQFSPSLNFYKFFGNTYNFVYSGLIAYPEDVSVFMKQ